MRESCKDPNKYRKCSLTVPSGQGGSSSSVGVFKGCDCSCNYVQTVSAQCQPVCSAAFAACQGERHKPLQSIPVAGFAVPDAPAIVPRNAEDFSNIGNDLLNLMGNSTVDAPANLRENFIELLAKNQPGPAMVQMREMMLKAFDEMPDDKAKMIMFTAMGGTL